MFKKNITSTIKYVTARILSGQSLVAQIVKNLPAVQETQVRSLGGKDPLQKEMANQSSILAWRIPWTEEPDGLQSMGSQRVRHSWVTEQQHLEKASKLLKLYVPSSFPGSWTLQ